MGKFDFVVGNPPWVRWGYLPEGYRDATLKLWKEYGLFSLSGIFPDDTILVENLPELGKRRISKVEERIEGNLVFPVVRGRDIRRWNAMPEIYALNVQDPKKREGYEGEWMKINLPRTFGYLHKFKDVLLSRGSNVVRELAEKTAFYTMYGIGEYTCAPYKVVWKRMASDLEAVVLSKVKTPVGEKEVEAEIDKVVAELYGITDEELQEINKALPVLKGE